MSTNSITIKKNPELQGRYLGRFEEFEELQLFIRSHELPGRSILEADLQMQMIQYDTGRERNTDNIRIE